MDTVAMKNSETASALKGNFTPDGNTVQAAETPHKAHHIPIIELDNITRSYLVDKDTLTVLKNISLSIEEGEFVAIMGPSGSGKSTLMQILGLLDRPSSGTYTLLGRDVSKLSDDEGAAMRSHTIGFIFQMFNLLPRTTALENVSMPMLYSGRPNREERATKLLHDVGLNDRMDHNPNELSGGQQQRVAIARALVNHPKILFADEPTGNLASGQAEDVLRQLRQLNDSGITVIMVTHEADIAAHAKRVVKIKDGMIVSDELNEQSCGQPSGAHADKKASLRDFKLAVPAISLAQFMEYGATALRATAANKVRSGLSVLGILIGVAAVIAMLAIGNGAQKSIEARLASMGSNVLMLFPGAPSSRGIRGAAGDVSRLTPEDATAISRMAGVQDLYPEAEGNVRVIYGNKNEVAEMQGVTPSYAPIRNATPQYGRFFSEAENTTSSRVAVLGPTIVKNLFGAENPLGKTVKVNGYEFRVIGILPAKGSGGGGDQDDMLAVPITTAMKRVLGTRYLHEMAIQSVSPERTPELITAITRFLRHRHRLPDFKEDDFTIRNNADMQATLSETTKTMTTLLGTIAAISLLVGGIGIMNIMLVSVNERTHEIGLRKAVGAPRRAILAQFLMEAAFLSGLGGLIGVGLGVLTSVSVATFAGWASEVTTQSVVMAFSFSVGLGIIFGFWPARKAALLSPIAALRAD